MMQFLLLRSFLVALPCRVRTNKSDASRKHFENHSGLKCWLMTASTPRSVIRYQWQKTLVCWIHLVFRLLITCSRRTEHRMCSNGELYLRHTRTNQSYKILLFAWTGTISMHKIEYRIEKKKYRKRTKIHFSSLLHWCLRQYFFYPRTRRSTHSTFPPPIRRILLERGVWSHSSLGGAKIGKANSDWKFVSIRLPSSQREHYHLPFSKVVSKSKISSPDGED